MEDNTKSPLNPFSTQDERFLWLKEKGIDVNEFTLLNKTEIIMLKQLCNQKIVLEAQVAQGIEDSKRLDIFEILFYTRKIFAVKIGDQLNWGFKIDATEFGPYKNIRLMIDAAVKNIEEVNKKLEQNGNGE